MKQRRHNYYNYYALIIRADCGVIRGATRNRGMPIHDHTSSSKLETKLGSEAWNKA